MGSNPVPPVEKNKNPELTKEAGHEIGVNYADLRQQQKEGTAGNGQIMPTTRTLEAMIRLSTAHARLRCSPKVEVEDVKVTNALLLRSRHLEVREVPASIPRTKADAEQARKKRQRDDREDTGGPKRGGDQDVEEKESDEIDDLLADVPDPMAKKAKKYQTGEDRVNEVQKAVFKFFTETQKMDASRDELDKWLAKKQYNFTEQEMQDASSSMQEKHMIMCELDHIYFVM